MIPARKSLPELRPEELMMAITMTAAMTASMATTMRSAASPMPMIRTMKVSIMGLVVSFRKLAHHQLLHHHLLRLDILHHHHLTKFWKKKRHMDRVKRMWFLSCMRAAKVQASLRIRAVSPEPSLLAHTSCEPRGTFRQKARSLAPLNGWACAVKICHDGMLEDTNSLDGVHMM